MLEARSNFKSSARLTLIMLTRVSFLLSLAVVTTMAQTSGKGDCMSSAFLLCLIVLKYRDSTNTVFDFVPGLGACGSDNTPEQLVASVSQVVFKNFK